ncbi:MAG: N-acetylglucosamine kinase [Flavobacteriaceae bacterium]|nr:N-acetylglucosamine kinase [Flavobacteriaceae bacterium]
MVLIADGGSTKCDWVALDDSGNTQFSTQTEGLNPAILQYDIILERLRKSEDLEEIRNKIATVHFYGAGCGTDSPKKLLTDTLSAFFPKAQVTVMEDTVAAVRSVTTEPGIVCILGTGSNSAYFDGRQIHPGPPSLGYLVMDEASGNYFGKKLLADYFYNKMPSAERRAFQEKFDLSPDTIKQNLYKEAHPNAYLATFGSFVFSDTKSAYFWSLIRNGLDQFIENRVLCFKESKQLPVHFIGSMAHFSRELLKERLSAFNLKLGTVLQRPIDGLAEYHRRNINP